MTPPVPDSQVEPIDRNRRFKAKRLNDQLKAFCGFTKIAGAAVFLASEAASYVTGHVLFVDRGHTAAM